ncbi:hypothetical protein ACFVVP_26095 [Streptomyces sp. NPDC058128]
MALDQTVTVAAVLQRLAEDDDHDTDSGPQVAPETTGKPQG